MIRTIVGTTVLSALVTVMLPAQGRSYWAYIEPYAEADKGIHSVRGACIFAGSYQAGGFVKAPELSRRRPDDVDKALKKIVRQFPSKQPLVGFDATGRTIRAQVESTSLETLNDLGFDTMSVNVRSRPVPTGGILLGTRAIEIHALRRVAARLSPVVDAALRKRADKLWKRHLPELPPDEPPRRYSLKPPIVDRVEGVPGLLVVLYPMDIEEIPTDSKEVEHDDRGQMFFIYSESDRRVIRENFGHPEWSLSSTAWTIKPDIFFRIGTDSDVLFVGASQGAWESLGHAIFDLRTGRAVLDCY